MRRFLADKLLLVLAISVFVLVVVRAHVQAITIDEALTYTNYVGPSGIPLWSAHSNDHLLNSLLMWIFTSVFGVSHLAVRAGALIGAALYISAAYRLCRLINDAWFVQIPLFVCLVLNPFILDFLVAARGYGLASGLLLWAIAIAAAATLRIYFAEAMDSAESRGLIVACGQASGLVALSFIANFSFAFVDAVLMIAIFVWACWSWASQGAGNGAGGRMYGQLALACALPVLLIGGGLAGPVALQMTKAELVFGAQSMAELLRSLYDASTFEVNPHVARALRFSSRRVAFLFQWLGFLSAAQVVLIFVLQRASTDPRSRWQRGLLMVGGGTIGMSLLVSWMAFRFGGILLPMDRTGIYFVVLATLFAGVLAAAPVVTDSVFKWPGMVVRSGLVAILFAFSYYFVICIRVDYFKEWKWGADTDRVYRVLTSYKEACGLTMVPANWRYDAALNFYRVTSGPRLFEPFPGSLGSGMQNYPENQPAYVLFLPEDEAFLEAHRLQVVYRSDFGAAVALDRSKCKE